MVKLGRAYNPYCHLMVISISNANIPAITKLVTAKTKIWNAVWPYVADHLINKVEQDRTI